MNTTCDEYIDQVRTKLDEVMEKLSEIVYTNNVWGKDQYTSEYLDKLAQALFEIRNARTKLT